MVKLAILNQPSRSEMTIPSPVPSSEPRWRWNPDARVVRRSAGDYEIPNFATGQTLSVSQEVGAVISRFSGLSIPFALPPALPDATLSALKKGRYLIEAEAFDAYQATTLRRISAMLEGSHGFIIMPTEKCNFRCTYCYESFEKGRMSPANVEALTKAIHLAASKADHFSLGFFGGEPLLCPDLLLHFSSEAFSIMRRRGLPYAAGVSTNASLLTLDLFKKLLAVGVVSYQISIDGDRELHDRQRVTAGGARTFDEIVANVRALKEVDDPFSVIVRCNVHEDDFERVEKLFRSPDLAALRGDPRFIVDIHTIWASDKKEVTVEKSGCSVPMQRQLEYFALNRKLEELGMTTVPYRKLPSLLSGACYAGKPNWFVVGPDLALYKCTVVFDREENRLGRIREDGALQIDLDKNRLWTGSNALTDGGCNNCHYRVPCGGLACPLTRFTDGSKQCPSMRSPTQLSRWADSRPTTAR